ncbi:hypothetical protein BDZ45DRAFT_745855 [Acephala macrosclerotiorum]|nr:hypothetical protein BDZ45DRAFT_745855 [Acephala macrosclerotiorum]
MAPKRKRNATAKRSPGRSQPPKNANHLSTVTRSALEPGATPVPVELLDQIFGLLDVVTATSFGLACKKFLKAYTTAFEARFKRPPKPAIKLLTEMELEDKTCLALYTTLQTWMGPDRSWNPPTKACSGLLCKKTGKAQTSNDVFSLACLFCDWVCQGMGVKGTKARFAGKWHDREQILEWSKQMAAEAKEAREEKEERCEDLRAEKEAIRESKAEDREIEREARRKERKEARADYPQAKEGLEHTRDGTYNDDLDFDWRENEPRIEINI